MKQKSGPSRAPAEQVLKEIRRQTRRQYSAEEKIRIVLEGLRGEENISELCRREGIAASMYYGWSKEFLEAGKRRLAGDTARAATSGEVKDLRREAIALKEVVADLTLENRLLKKSMNGDGEDEARDILRLRRPRSSSWSSSRTCRPSARWTSSVYREPRSIAGMIVTVKAALEHWPIIGRGRTGSGTASPTMSAARSSIWRWNCQSCRRESWPCGSPTSRSILSRRLQSIGC
jgi:transposase